MNRFTKIILASIAAAAALVAVAPPSAQACGSYFPTAEQLEQRQIERIVGQHLREVLDRELVAIDRVRVRGHRAAVRVRMRPEGGPTDRELTQVVWLRRGDAEGWRVSGVSRPRIARTSPAS